MNSQPALSAGVVVLRRTADQWRYLLLRAGSYWDFPKGNVEKDEEDQEAAAREIKEETGLTDFTFVSNFKEKINYFYRKKEQTIFKEVIFFLVEAVSEKIKLSLEHVEYGWFDFVEASKKLRENSAKILQKADEFLKTKL